MDRRAARLLAGLCIMLSSLLWAQTSTLSGKVTGSSGAPLANAKLTIKNVATGQSTETQTDASGFYTVPSLGPGDYEISVSEGSATQTAHETLTAGTTQTVDLTLATTQPGNLPNAPSSSKTAPSLSDLGFTPEQTQGDAKRQALLDKRTHMLKIHQRMGLITAAPLIATLATSINAGGRNTSNTDRTVHMVLGATTADLYFITAYFAIRAPRVPGAETHGPIRFHKAMAWIHGPGMILTPILGAMAYSQKNNGEKVHGIAQAHGPVAIVTAGAFGAALLSVSVKF